MSPNQLHDGRPEGRDEGLDVNRLRRFRRRAAAAAVTSLALAPFAALADEAKASATTTDGCSGGTVLADADWCGVTYSTAGTHWFPPVPKGTTVSYTLIGAGGGRGGFEGGPGGAGREVRGTLTVQTEAAEWIVKVGSAGGDGYRGQAGSGGANGGAPGGIGVHGGGGGGGGGGATGIYPGLVAAPLAVAAGGGGGGGSIQAQVVGEPFYVPGGAGGSLVAGGSAGAAGHRTRYAVSGGWEYCSGGNGGSAGPASTFGGGGGGVNTRPVDPLVPDSNFTGAAGGGGAGGGGAGAGGCGYGNDGAAGSGASGGRGGAARHCLADNKQACSVARPAGGGGGGGGGLHGGGGGGGSNYIGNGYLTGGGGGEGSSLGAVSSEAVRTPIASFRWPRRISTSTALSSSPSSTTYGSPVTFVARVSSSAPATAGTVSFAADGQTVAGCGAQPVARNALTGRIEATCTTTALRSGSRSVVASYSGYVHQDAIRVPSTSPAFIHVVARATSKMTVACTPNPVVHPSKAQCTASVSGPGMPPTGKVSWTTSGTGTFLSTTCVLSGGTCSVTYNTAGSDIRTTGGIRIHVSYSGDTNHNGTANAATLAVRAG